jgi:hypothetical protein
MSNLIPIAEKYFSYFRNKEIQLLKKLFSKNINLRDWEINISGLDNVIEQNIKIFESLDKFELQIIKLYQSENVIFGEINIILKNNEIIKVLDKIVFDEECKIKEIIAFKG